MGDDRFVPPDRSAAPARGRFATTGAEGWNHATPPEPPYLLSSLTDGRGVAVSVTGDATTAVVELVAHGGWSPHFGDQITACLRVLGAGPSDFAIIDLHHLDDPAGLSMPFWMDARSRARHADLPVNLIFCLPERACWPSDCGSSMNRDHDCSPARRRHVWPSPPWRPSLTGCRSGWRRGRSVCVPPGTW